MSAGTPTVRVRRVYEERAADDGVRVLVDALWPRGLRNDGSHLDEWRKEVAPSAQLRSWYAHDPEKFDEFADRYRAELDDVNRAAALVHLRELAAHGTLTLLSASRAIDISNAAVLADIISG